MSSTSCGVSPACRWPAPRHDRSHGRAARRQLLHQGRGGRRRRGPLPHQDRQREKETDETKQISVFIENRPGRLASVAEVLGDEGIDIRAISMADAPDFGIFRLVVEDTDRAGRR